MSNCRRACATSSGRLQVAPPSLEWGRSTLEPARPATVGQATQTGLPPGATDGRAGTGALTSDPSGAATAPAGRADVMREGRDQVLPPLREISASKVARLDELVWRTSTSVPFRSTATMLPSPPRREEPKILLGGVQLAPPSVVFEKKVFEMFLVQAT